MIVINQLLVVLDEVLLTLICSDGACTNDRLREMRVDG